MRAYGKIPPGFVRGLAREAGVTVGHFGRVFRRITGVTLGGYAGGVLNGLSRSTSISGNGSGNSNASGSVSVSGSADEFNWNIFDVLFAAEEGCVSGQDIQSTDDWLPMDVGDSRSGDLEGQALPLAWASGHRHETGVISGRDDRSSGPVMVYGR